MERNVNNKSYLHYRQTLILTIDENGSRFPSLSGLDQFLVNMGSGPDVFVSTGDEEEVKLTSGDLLYVAAGRTVQAHTDGVVEGRLAVITFTLTSDDAKSTSYRYNATGVFRMPQIKDWMSAFTSYDESGDEADFLHIQSRLYAIAANCLRASSSLSDFNRKLLPFAAQVQKQISEQYDTIADLDGLAQSYGMGARKFYSETMKYFGVSPHRFLTTTRLSASLRLLAEPGSSISQVAHSIGYQDEYYFSRLFKKEMGMTPTEFTSRAQLAIACLCGVFSGDFAVFGITPGVMLHKDWEYDTAHWKQYLQQIIASSPRFIVAQPIEEALHKELAEIGLVTIIEWKAVPWKQRLLGIGDLLNLRSVAQWWLKEFDQKSVNARRYIGQHFSKEPFLIIGVRERKYRLYGEGIYKLSDLLYKELGFRMPQAVQDIVFIDSDDLAEFSALDCEHVLFIIEFPATESQIRELETQWRAMKQCSKHANCFFIRVGEPFLYNASMYKLLVDQTVSYLLTKEK